MVKYSVYNNEQELLKDLIQLHCKTDIQLDPTYNKGGFYKGDIKEPIYKFDIKPRLKIVEKADARDLPLKKKSIYTMMIDPPFMFGNHGQQKKYYCSGTFGIIKDFETLKKTYRDMIREGYRVLKKSGILLFKCQDYTDAVTTLTHCHVWSSAINMGFKVKDLAILNLPKNKIYNSKLKQRHLRKVHSYFFVFKK